MSLTIEVFAPLGEYATAVDLWEIQSISNEQLWFGTWWIWKPRFRITVQGIINQLCSKDSRQR